MKALLLGLGLLPGLAAAQRPDTASLTNVWRLDSSPAVEIRQVQLFRSRHLIGVCLFIVRADGRLQLLHGGALTDTAGGPARCDRRWRP